MPGIRPRWSWHIVGLVESAPLVRMRVGEKENEGCRLHLCIVYFNLNDSEASGRSPAWAENEFARLQVAFGFIQLMSTAYWVALQTYVAVGTPEY
jgi:hypothetical protein